MGFPMRLKTSRKDCLETTRHMNIISPKNAIKLLKKLKIGEGQMNWKIAWNAMRLTGTILIHKACVAFFCIKARLYWRAIVHDLSKFHPKEFWESIQYYDGNVSPTVGAKRKNGWSEAWQHHKGSNPHHHEYWVDDVDYGMKMLRMPFDDVMELICDGLGACIAYNRKLTGLYQNEWSWWINGPMKKAVMHPHTRMFIHTMLKRMKEENSSQCLDPIIANMEYEALKYRLAGTPVSCAIEDCQWKEPESTLDKEFWKV